MVEAQLVRRGIADARVLAAARRVPREAFVPGAVAAHAYADGPLPIGSGQTISQPYIVALMAEAAALRPSDRVLEIGTGSGYAAAILGLLAARVLSIERHATLAETARARLAARGFSNVDVRIGDGTLGWPEAAPFDAILVTAGAPEIPAPLLEQLAPDGRLVAPVGDRAANQRLLKIIRTGADGYREQDLGGVMFVPLIGARGWDAEGADPVSARRVGKGGVPLPAKARGTRP